jgi:hypothetical protein
LYVFTANPKSWLMVEECVFLLKSLARVCSGELAGTIGLLKAQQQSVLSDTSLNTPIEFVRINYAFVLIKFLYSKIKKN